MTTHPEVSTRAQLAAAAHEVQGTAERSTRRPAQAKPDSLADRMAARLMPRTESERLLDRWRVHQFAAFLSRRTVNERETAVRAFGEQAGVEPASATTEDIASWLARGRWSGATRHTYWCHLRAWFRWLAINGHREDDPTVVLASPRRPYREVDPVSNADIERLLWANMWPRTRAKLLLAVYAGLRVSEIAAIRGEHFDWTESVVTVLGKGGRIDTIPLHPELLPLRLTMPATGWWFPSETTRGGHVLGRSVGMALKDLMLRNGIRGSAHRLRHSFGTNLVVNGADARTAQSLLRHASLQSTQIYVHVADQRRADAINRLDFRKRAAVTGPGARGRERVRSG